MYKSLSAALLAALTAYLYFYLELDFTSYTGYFSRPNIASPLPASTYNVSEMAVASISRSVVQKVLSIETPEVRRAIQLSLHIYANVVHFRVRARSFAGLSGPRSSRT